MRQLLWTTLVVAVVAGCGGGGGGPAPAYDLNGWWEYGVRMPGSAEDYRTLALLPLAQQGGAVELMGAHLTLDGSSLRGSDPEPPADFWTEYELTVLSSDQVEGRYVERAPPDHEQAVEMRLRRVDAPAGTLTINGVLAGEALSRVTATAYAAASVHTHPADPWYRLSIFDMRAEGVTTLVIRFPQDPPFPARTYAVGGGLIPIEAEFWMGLEGGTATAGTVTFSRIDASRVTGSFLLTLDAPGTVAGTFDAETRLSRTVTGDS